MSEALPGLYGWCTYSTCYNPATDHKGVPLCRPHADLITTSAALHKAQKDAQRAWGTPIDDGWTSLVEKKVRTRFINNVKETTTMEQLLRVIGADQQIEVDSTDLWAHRKLLADQVREQFGGVASFSQFQDGFNHAVEEIADWLDS